MPNVMPTQTIASVIRNGIAAGLSNAEIVGRVHAAFPGANTNRRNVSWYRNRARAAARAANVGITGAAPVATAWSPAPARTARRRSSTRIIPLDTPFDAQTGLTDRPFGIEFEFKGGGRNIDHYGAAVRSALAQWPNEIVNVRAGYFHSNGRQWDVKLDGSAEYELATPKLYKSDWPKVVAVLAALRRAGATVDRSCGVHVHHETRGLRLPALRNLIKLFGAFDRPLHESLPESRRANSYCRRWDETVSNQIATMTGPSLRREVRARNRYVALNLLNWWRHGRIEVRSHHGTLDADKTGYWLQITQAMVERAAEGRFGRLLEGIADERDRFARIESVIGETATRVLAAWAEERNPDYFNQINGRAA